MRRGCCEKWGYSGFLVQGWMGPEAVESAGVGEGVLVARGMAQEAVRRHASLQRCEGG